MKQILCKSLKTLSLLMLLVLFLIPQNHEAQNRKKKKKDANSESVQKPPAKDKEKTIKELVKSSKEIDGLFKISCCNSCCSNCNCSIACLLINIPSFDPKY